ncbi:DUF1127 domain-containing protein [Consotaella aegiceratis]
MLNTLVKRYRAYRSRRHTIDVLRRLEDWELDDIGVRRGDLGRVL